MKNKYKLIFEKALRAGSEKDYTEAVRLLNSIIIETDEIHDAFLYLGRSYHALGDYDNAVKMLKFFISYETVSPKGYFFLGRTYLTINNPLKSAKYFSRALDFSPENPEILSLLGISLIKLKKINSAVFLLEKAVSIDPDNRSIYNAYINALYLKGIREFYYGDRDISRQILEFIKKNENESESVDIYLAMIEKENGNYQEALNLYISVSNKNPDDHMLKIQIIPLLIQAGREKEAAAILADLSDKNIPINIHNFKNTDINRFLAIEYFYKNNFKESLLYAKKVIYDNYYDNDMHLLMGEIFRITDQYQKAENHFNLVLKRNSDKIEARYGKIMILWIQERFEELYKETLNMINRFPDDDISKYYRSLTVCKLNHPSETTIPLLMDEIKKNKKDPYLFNALGNEYLKISRSDLAEKWFLNALKIHHLKESYSGLIKSYYYQDRKNKISPVFIEYLEKYPEDSKMRKYFIHHLYNLGKYNKAIKEIEKYGLYNDAGDKIMRLLAKCYMNTEKIDKAIVVYRKLLSENPEKLNYLMSYSFCLEKMDKRRDAIEILEKSINHFNKNNRILLTVGVLYFKEEDYEKAQNYFRKVLENNEKEWRAYYNISRIYEIQGLKDMSEKFMSHAERYKKMLDI